MSLEIHYRNASISRRGIDEKARTCELSFASEDPAQRSFGLEILQCDSRSVNLSRLNNGGNLLMDHDPTDVVGGIDNARVDNDKKCRAQVRFSKSARASEVFDDVLANIRQTCSVGYTIDEMEEAGEQDGEPVYRVTRWTPHEISLTSLPLDATVGIGRSLSTNQTNKKQAMNPHTIENQPRGRMTRTQEQEHSQKIRDYIADLRNPAWKAKAENIAEQSILEGLTFAEFRARALPHFTSDVQLIVPSENGVAGNSSHRSFDGMNNRSVGGQIVANREHQQLLRGGKKTVSFLLPGIASIRSVGTSQFGGTVEHLGAPIYANQRLTIADLLAAGQTSAGTVRYPRENSFTPSATTVGEAGQKPEQSFDLEPVDMPARKIAAWTRISSELLQDAPAAEAYLTNHLEFAVLREEEKQVLFGDGLGTNLNGIFTTPGVQTQAKGGDTAPDALRKAIGNVAINSDFEASGIVINPQDWQNIELLKTTTGEYRVGNVFVRSEMGMLIKAPSIFGLPVVVTKSTPAGTALVGDFARAAQLFRRTGVLIEMSNSDGDNFTRNLVTVLAELRALVATYAPSAFCDVTGL